MIFYSHFWDLLLKALLVVALVVTLVMLNLGDSPALWPALVILTVLYWIVVVPIGLIRRTGRRSAARPEWKRRTESGPIAIEQARRQF